MHELKEKLEEAVLARSRAWETFEENVNQLFDDLESDMQYDKLKDAPYTP